MKKLIIILLLISNVCYSDQSTYLNKDDKAPYDGFLLDREKASKVRLLDIDYKEALKTQEYLKTDNELYVKRLENMTQENDRLSKQLVEARDPNIWDKIGFFFLGALVTTGIAYGVSRATR